MQADVNLFQKNNSSGFFFLLPFFTRTQQACLLAIIHIWSLKHDIMFLMRKTECMLKEQKSDAFIAYILCCQFTPVLVFVHLFSAAPRHSSVTFLFATTFQKKSVLDPSDLIYIEKCSAIIKVTATVCNLKSSSLPKIYLLNFDRNPAYGR